MALAHLQRLGYRLLARNWRSARGEIDLIVRDARTIVFVEVKCRRRGGLDPLLAVNAVKRRRMRTAAVAWLADDPDRPRAPELRFDAIAVVVDGSERLVALDHVEDIATGS
jgi:putative endonuclease